MGPIELDSFIPRIVSPSEEPDQSTLVARTGKTIAAVLACQPAIRNRPERVSKKPVFLEEEFKDRKRLRDEENPGHRVSPSSSSMSPMKSPSNVDQTVSYLNAHPQLGEEILAYIFGKGVQFPTNPFNQKDQTGLLAALRSIIFSNNPTFQSILDQASIIIDKEALLKEVEKKYWDRFCSNVIGRKIDFNLRELYLILNFKKTGFTSQYISEALCSINWKAHKNQEDQIKLYNKPFSYRSAYQIEQITEAEIELKIEELEQEHMEATTLASFEASNAEKVGEIEIRNLEEFGFVEISEDFFLPKKNLDSHVINSEEFLLDDLEEIDRSKTSAVPEISLMPKQSIPLRQESSSSTQTHSNANSKNQVTEAFLTNPIPPLPSNPFNETDQISLRAFLTSNENSLLLQEHGVSQSVLEDDSSNNLDKRVEHYWNQICNTVVKTEFSWNELLLIKEYKKLKKSSFAISKGLYEINSSSTETSLIPLYYSPLSYRSWEQIEKLTMEEIDRKIEAIFSQTALHNKGDLFYNCFGRSRRKK